MKINLVRDLHDEEILDALPVEGEDGPARTEAIETIWGLFEVLLKAPGRLDAFIRDPGLVGRLLTGFTVVVVIGFVAYGLAIGGMLLALPAEAVPGLLKPQWSGNWRSVAALGMTYPAGLLLATALCVPSYWYFAHLGGARMTLAQTLAYSLKGKASTTVLLLGLLPIYAIVMLGLISVGVPAEILNVGAYVGLVLPFFVGLRGVYAVYTGFESMVTAMPAKERRARFALPGWLVLMWASRSR